MEIEIKLKVDDFEPVIQRLKSAGAEFRGDFTQVDSYFDDPQDSLVNSDRCLRIRNHRSVKTGQETIELTYKGKRENNHFKARREIGIKVEKAQALAEVFENLGYKKRLEFEKKRSIWALGDCEVALDQLPLLGKFIEIEGPSDEKITTAQKKLALDKLTHNPKSYAHLIEEQLTVLGAKQRQITFKSAENL